MSEPDPLTVACPRCLTAIGEACVKPDGRPAPKAHAGRVKGARALRDRRARSPVPERITEERWRRLYRAARMELEQRGDWTVAAGEQLESMVRNMRNADKARGGAENEPIVDGSTGQKVANPLFAIALRLDAQALTIAKALKLTPDTRGTSAPVGGDAGEDPEEAGDDLTALDELAAKRKEKAQASRQRR